MRIALARSQTDACYRGSADCSGVRCASGGRTRRWKFNKGVGMKDLQNRMKRSINRRSFMKNGLGVAGVAAAGTGFLVGGSSLLADDGKEERGGRLDNGDAAILRFLAAAEIIETDLWQQYNELGGIQDKEVPGGNGSPVYTAALQVLDGDMDQYINENLRPSAGDRQYSGISLRHHRARGDQSLPVAGPEGHQRGGFANPAEYRWNRDRS